MRGTQGVTDIDSTSHSATETDEVIFRRLYPKLAAYAAVVADAGIDADDLVQDALVSTLRSSTLTDLEHPQAYLRKAILRTAIDGQRRASSYQRIAPRLSSAGADEPTYPSDLADLDHLEPRDRAILYLVHVEGCSFHEVAELTGESAQNARTRASRARTALRKALTAEATTTGFTTTDSTATDSTATDDASPPEEAR